MNVEDKIPESIKNDIGKLVEFMAGVDRKVVINELEIDEIIKKYFPPNTLYQPTAEDYNKVARCMVDYHKQQAKKILDADFVRSVDETLSKINQCLVTIIDVKHDLLKLKSEKK